MLTKTQKNTIEEALRTICNNMHGECNECILHLSEYIPEIDDFVGRCLYIEHREMNK